MAEQEQQQQQQNQDQQRPQEVNFTPKVAKVGLNLDSIISDIPQGMLTYALNAQLENFDGNQVTYQNEQANEPCATFPAGYKVCGIHNIVENGYAVVFLVNEDTGDSEIGIVHHNTCTYETKINAKCLNFSMDDPILKAVHKLTNCSTEVYWPSKNNPRRFIDLDNLPFQEIEGCPPTITGEIDCNKLNVQPDFAIPQIEVEAVDSDGETPAGTYQFAVQYCNALGEGYTGYYSVTNPLPLQDPNKITLDFNYLVNKSIRIRISNIDVTGFFDYLNVAVIKTINNITSTELIDTFQIIGSTKNISYTGEGKQNIRLTMDDIIDKFPIYERANDLTVVNDILVWDQLTTDEQISYQRIANNITLQWQTWRLDGNQAYANPLNSVYLRGYMRDEVYPFEIVFLLDNGKQTDGFHIPGRVATQDDLIPISGPDVVHGDLDKCDPNVQPLPKWRVYNTGCLIGYEQEFLNFIGGNPEGCIKCIPGENTNPSDPRCYVGPHQYGCMAYWESTETYPCNEEVWGELSGQPIRHHKFPDSVITHIHDNDGFIYPIGARIDVQQIIDLIRNSNLTPDQKARIQGFKIVRGNRATNKSVKAKGLIHNVGRYDRDGQTYYFPNYPFNDLRTDPFLATRETTDDSGLNEGIRLHAFTTDESKQRYVFHSPDTHFYQPTLGNILKLETAEFGQARGHFLSVRDHARYSFLTSGAYASALVIAAFVGVLSGTFGVTAVQAFDGTAAFTAFQTFIDIMAKLLPKKNFAYQFNSLGNYTNFKVVENNGNKQRRTDLEVYLSPGMQGVGDIHTINNYQRESSVYFRTIGILPYTNTIAGVPEDRSRYLNSQMDPPCTTDIITAPISSYYASIKEEFLNQYGQIYSYETIDTGFQELIDVNANLQNSIRPVFGGDVFINKFAYKSKLPFFLENRVFKQSGLPEDPGSTHEDVEYNQIPNVANPIFWFSTDVRNDTGGPGGVLGIFKQLLGVKINNFDCRNDKFFYQDGKIYLFAYGIPYFYAESEVNVDMRGAFNQIEGDFYPRMSSDIPDEWLQEVNTTIQQDNTYHYNRTYSKQNKENLFTHLPQDFTDRACRKNLQFRAIFSEKQEDVINYDRNNWLIYKPLAFFDFPRNYGRITSMESIEDRQVLVRFENKTLLYNALQVQPSSTTEVFTGGSIFLKEVPPQDLAADNDLGYNGSQHKLFLKSEYGHISVDAKRGQVFLIPRRLSSYYKPQTKDLSNTVMSKFFTENLDFQIKRAFPDIDIDNHFKGIGLTGIYDNKYNRLIITKLDYAPAEGVTFENGKFFAAGEEVQLTDREFFCNRSFTISYDFDSNAWVSFHSYIPNYYVGESNFFYTGENGNSVIWRHNTAIGRYNTFYGRVAPYSIEYPVAFKFEDEILQSVRDYTKVYEYIDSQTFIETDDVYFNEAILSNNQQCSGVLKLTKKPQNNLAEYGKFPKYNADSKEIIYTKSDNFRNFNTFWALNKDIRQPIWLKSCTNISTYKDLNQSNMDYSKRSFKKAPLRAKDLKIRLTLTNTTTSKLVSQFIVAETQKSYK